jgi:hypothetical protein
VRNSEEDGIDKPQTRERKRRQPAGNPDRPTTHPEQFEEFAGTEREPSPVGPAGEDGSAAAGPDGEERNATSGPDDPEP